MKPALVDVSVLILFFNRPKLLAQVFEQVKKARPARLFLYQDGPRGERDMPGIEACRKVVADIDWECEVHHNYQEKNYGCDPSEYMAQKWAFSLSDKCIVLEDDDVPAVSFFGFCKELLDKYEHDTRISMIAGFNNEEITPDITSDYFFATTFSIWGWASWRRVTDQWDEFYTFLEEPHPHTALPQRLHLHVPTPPRTRESLLRNHLPRFHVVQFGSEHRAHPQHDKQSGSHCQLHPLYRLRAHHAARLPPHLHHETPRSGVSTEAPSPRHREHCLQG